MPWVPPAPGGGPVAFRFTRRPEALATAVDRTPPRLALPGHRMTLLALPAGGRRPFVPAIPSPPAIPAPSAIAATPTVPPTPAVPATRSVSASLTVPASPAGSGSRVRRLASAPVRMVRLAVKAVLAVATVGLAFTVAGTLTGGWGLVPVLTGSMRPGIQPGDAVFVTPEPLSAVRAGQVLVFQPPGEGGASVVHRVVAVTGDPTGPVIRTKGDANNVADPWKAQLGGTRAWRVRAVVPKIGYLTLAEHNPQVRLALEAILVLAGLGIGLTVIWKPASRGDGPAAAGAAA